MRTAHLGTLGEGRPSVTLGGVLFAAGAVGLLVWFVSRPGDAGFGEEAEFDADAYVLERHDQAGDRSVAGVWRRTPPGSS